MASPPDAVCAGSSWAQDEHAQPEHNQSVQVRVWYISGSLPCKWPRKRLFPPTPSPPPPTAACLLPVHHTSILLACFLNVLHAMSAMYIALSTQVRHHIQIDFLHTCCISHTVLSASCHSLHHKAANEWQATSDMLTALQELMSRMFLVNIPLMFAAVWRVLQMFVDDRVKAKIRFLRKADFHILHEFVDRDQLPESLGGKAKEKLLSDKQGRFIRPASVHHRYTFCLIHCHMPPFAVTPLLCIAIYSLHAAFESMCLCKLLLLFSLAMWLVHLIPTCLTSFRSIMLEQQCESLLSPLLDHHHHHHCGAHFSYCCAGFVPASLLAVNAEVQRRTDAKQAATKPKAQPALDQPDPQSTPTPTPAEPPLSKDSYYSIIDPSADLPAELHTSSSTDDLASQSSGPILVSELPTHHQPVGMTEVELSKLAALKSGAQQAQHAQQPAGAQPGVPGAAHGPVNIVAKADSQKVAAAPVQAKQRRKSKREKARGLLSSFTSSRKQMDSKEEDMDQALQMLSELRRTESTPNVEAEALKRNKGGGGPWMSFTRHRRPPKPRPAKKGGASPRRGSPLATVVSGECYFL